MEKLTIEHLAPYLPYKLMIYCDFRDGDIMHFEMESISIEEAYLDGCDWDYKNNNDFKPILRPLSDLLHEINEEKPRWFPSSNTIKLIKQERCILTSQYNEINYLIRNHFDIFGLIKKGLAIDINTLK